MWNNYRNYIEHSFASHASLPALQGESLVSSSTEARNWNGTRYQLSTRYCHAGLQEEPAGGKASWQRFDVLVSQSGRNLVVGNPTLNKWIIIDHLYSSILFPAYKPSLKKIVDLPAMFDFPPLAGTSSAASACTKNRFTPDWFYTRTIYPGWTWQFANIRYFTTELWVLSFCRILAIGGTNFHQFVLGLLY